MGREGTGTEVLSAWVSGWRRYPRSTLAGILILAFFLRVLAAGFGGPITPDGVYYYVPSAVGLSEGDLDRGNPPTHHPGYPAVMALFLLFGLPPEWSGRWVSVLAGTAAVIPVFLIGRRLGGGKAGWLSAAMLTVLPLHVQFSGWVQTEALFTLLVALSMERLVAFSQGGPTRAVILAGLFTGLGATVRGEAILLVPLFAVAALYRGPGLRRWGAVVAGGGLMLALGSSTSVLFYRNLGRFSYSPGSNIVFVLGQQEDRRTRYDCFFRIAPPGDVLEFYYASTREGFEPGLKGRIILEDPAKFLRLYVDKVGRLMLSYAPKGFHWSWLPAMVLGWVLLIRRRTPGGALPILHFFLLIAALSAYFVQKRFWVPLAPATVPCAAVGFAALFEWARARRAGTLVIAGLLLTVVVSLADVYQCDEGWNASRARAAAQSWARTCGVNPGDHVLTDVSYLPFYSGIETSELPVASFEAALTYARRRGADGILQSVDGLRYRDERIEDPDRAPAAGRQSRGWERGFLDADARPITIDGVDYLYLSLE